MNRIDAVIEFSYQGQTYKAMASIDLDGLMQNHAQLPDLYQYLAQHNGIDTYSYLYEVMEAHPIEYTNATGLAQLCLHNGQFDLADFQLRWQQEQELNILAQIAYSHLGIEDLEQNPELKAALLEAYSMGKETVNS